MQPFERVRGVAAPLDRDNVDTDSIIAQRWLVTTTRAGLGRGLFAGWRYTAAGVPRPEFILNQPAYAHCRILVAGANYGCGSSREHAVWAHADAGIRAVIAPSYGPIFYDNCFKNGILPVTLDGSLVRALMAALLREPGAEITVDLVDRTVVFPDAGVHGFEVDDERRRRLLGGLDDIAITLGFARDIDAFQKADRVRRPWVWTVRGAERRAPPAEDERGGDFER